MRNRLRMCDVIRVLNLDRQDLKEKSLWWYLVYVITSLIDSIGMRLYRLRDRPFTHPIWEDTNVWIPILQYLKMFPKPFVLDVGCGDGPLSILCAKMGANVEGFDISPIKVAQAKSNANAAGLINVRFRCFNANKSWSYSSNSFDIILLHHVYEHLIKRDLVLSESHRVLRVGGKLIIVVPLITSLRSVIFQKYIFSDPTHVIEFTKDSITRELQTKFRVDECYEYGFDPLIRRIFTPLFALFPSQVSRISQKLKDNFGPANIMSICTKIENYYTKPRADGEK